MLDEQAFLRRAVEATIRVGSVILVAVWCFDIVKPFIAPVTWGLIIAVATYPLYARLARRLGERRRVAAALFTVLMLVVLITPTYMLARTLVDTASEFAAHIEHGTLEVPPPSDKVAAWPLIGKRLHAFWSLASENLSQAVDEMEPQFRKLGPWVLNKGASVGFGILQFVVAILIAGVLLANAAGGRRFAHAFASRLMGARGDEIAALAGATVRSVARGVLGVAFLQAMLAGVGLLAAEVPAAGVWALLVLLVAVVQLPPILVLGPIIVYVFSVATAPVAIGFMIWSILVSASDAVLKPLLLGRGVQIPMLVILVGAIGGLVTSGIIGLFVGSVILALAYKLFVAWLEGEGPSVPSTPAADGGGG